MASPIELVTRRKGGDEPSLNNEEEREKLYAYAFQVAGACAVPMVLNAIVDMGVLQMIYDQAGPNGLSAAEIATRIPAKNPDAPCMLDRLLRLLASYSIVGCTAVATADNGVVERRYRPSPVTEFFVPDEDGVSVASGVALFVDTVFIQSWSKLKEAVVEGGAEPFKMVHGMDAFEYFANNSRFKGVFHKAMHVSTSIVLKEILAKYKGFETISKLVDVGGSLGHTLRAITSQYPSIQGINFDLPYVIESAPPCPGVDHVGGDMFENVPSGDAIFMKWILHDWSDDHCINLLKNCYKALPENGKVIVVETVMPEEPENTDIARATSLIDVTMMTQHVGGKERTFKEFEALSKGAGFSDIQLVCFARGCWVIEFYK